MIYRYSPMYLVSMLIFLFLGDWTGSFNGVRQYLASAMLFAGHRYIFKQQFIKYLITVLIASLFHITAIVMIIPYFILNRKANIVQFILLGIGAVIVLLSYDLIFEIIANYKKTVINYSDPYMTRDINPLRIAVCFLPLMIYFTTCNRNNLNPEQQFYINALFVNAFAMLAGISSAYFGRIGIHTGAMVSIGYSHLFNLIEDTRNKKAVTIIVMCTLFVYWVYSLGNGSFRWIFDA